MSAGKPFSYVNPLKAIVAGCVLMLAFASCAPTFVKKYPKNKPFVYQTKINLIGKFTNDEKARLISGLEDQMDDSVKARKIDYLLWQSMKKPPAYDSINADKSVIFMQALLISQGYFYDSIWYKSEVKFEKPDKYRTYLTFYVRPGKVVRLDSISYKIQHPELQKLADSTKKQAFIQKGDPFAKGPISGERDRLTELYRNNGYLRFARDEIVGIWDTLDVSFLQPSIDPFEQFEMLKRLRERHENPTANLEIRLKSVDSTKLVKYYVGNVTVYPDYSLDTIGLTPKTTMVEGIKIIQYHNKFKAGIFPPNIYLPHGSVYSQRRYVRTINRLSALGAWRTVYIDQLPRKNEDTVDFVIRLSPAKKRLFSINLEGSINQNTSSGTLFGIGVNVGVQNRNLGKASNHATTNIRYGIELGGSGNLVQTQSFSVGHNIYFPRAIFFNRWLPENRKDNWRTILSANAAYVDRRSIYSQSTLNSSWGYEYQRRNVMLAVKFPNIEYSLLHKRDSLDSLIKRNPTLKNIFTDGLIVSTIVNFTLTGGQNNNLNVMRANFEGAPLFVGFIHSPFLDSEVYRFMKVDVELARLIRYKKSSIAMRFFAGLGIADPFGTTVNQEKQYALPFFKQYFSGGPNSMRAWALRRLGPGSVIRDFDGEEGAPDRYGDVQLEANLEYRFPLFKPLGVKVNGALFTDIGNVWLLKASAGPPEAVFNLSRLGEDIAVGMGAGLRIDLNFFVLRFDYSYKVKDPSPTNANASLQNKWFGYSFFKGDQFQLGIGYPFIF